MNLLIDKEVDLNQKDSLHTNSYAKSLAKLIMESPGNTPMTIGLFGEWGSGKSSIIKTLKEDLEAEKSTHVKFVIYDSWKYANDSFRRMFLLKVQTALGLRQTKKMSSFYVNENTEVDIKRSFNLPFLTLIVVALMVLLAIYSALGSPGPGTITVAIVLSILGFLTSVFSKAFNEYKVTSQQPHLFAPEQFEECFNEIVRKALKKTTTFQKVTEFIQGEYNGDIDKLVIVIDNIDRCHKEIAYELLTNTKNFIDTGLDVIFLIPVDDNALKKHIFKNEKEGSKESEEFLRKYFNVTIRIKPYKVTEIFDFAAGLNSESKLGFKPDTINIIAKEYASNPRRIIQFYNNLQLELIVMKDKYGESFIKQHEIAICKFLIIREEWHKEYLGLCQNPDLFFSEDYQSLKEKTDNGYKEFLDATYVSTRAISYDILQKLLINSDNYDSLPDSIQNAIRSNDFSTFKEILQETGFTEKRTVDHLLFSLNKAVNSKLFTTEIPEVLDQLYIFLANHPGLDASYSGRLEEAIRKNIGIHISNTKNAEHLVAFNEHALSIGYQFMETAIKGAFHEFNHEPDLFFDSPLFELYDAYVHVITGERLEYASKGFQNYLNSAKLSDPLDRKFKPDQLAILYTQDIISKYLINESLYTWNDADNYDRWRYLVGVLPDQTGLIKALLNDVQRSLNVELAEAGLYIEVFNNIFSVVNIVNPDEELLTTLSAINQIIFESKRPPNQGRAIKYLDVIPQERIQQTMNYLMECYRISGGMEYVWVSELVSAHGEDVIKEKLSNMINTYPELNYGNMKSMVLGWTNIDALTNSILLHMLYQTKGRDQNYTNQEIQSMLNKLIASTRSDNKYADLLSQHLSKELGMALLPELLIQLPEEQFTSLTSDLQNSTFDLMTDKSNIGKYKTNFSVLNMIAKSGKANHVHLIMNTIKSNLLDPQTTEQSIDLIGSLNHISSDDCSDLAEYLTKNKISDLGDKKKVGELLKKLKPNEK